ncbi:probable carboxylesterase 12 [Rhodamnia argentea]|uniref:Probable carboxylesterase 12 n=1 Tax=Rhodamnia argentea TaxID=178133 RepID=A0A8B8NMW5_9MYRT|nr:probable carboxylesterase 12 [Rhodamnia argentea]
MASEISQDFSPFLRIYKDGHIERLIGTATVPASLDDKTGVASKDVAFSSDPAVSARLYLPAAAGHPKKLPLLVYFHGGGFCIETASSPTYHNYLNAVASEANVVVVSVDYRRAPEDPLPAAYDDSWAALQWVASHRAGDGPDDWLNEHANLNKVFLAGDSAGANIAHHMGLRIGSDKLDGLAVAGIALVHPFFWGSKPVGTETTDPERRAWTVKFTEMACPTFSGADDPIINPESDPGLGGLCSDRILVFVAEKDMLRSRGWYYEEVLKKSGWRGSVEVVETKGEDHVFHLMNPSCENAVEMMKTFVKFLNE